MHLIMFAVFLLVAYVLLKSFAYAVVFALTRDTYSTRGKSDADDH